MRVRGLAVAALAVLLVGVVAATALAGKAETTVIVTKADPVYGVAEYVGKVSSPKGKCKKHRKVTVIHDSDPPFTIGETETDEHGHWSLEGPYPRSANDDRIVVKVKGNKRCKKDSTSFRFYDDA